MKDKIIKYSDTKAEKVDKRILRFVGSDESVDRDGDIIRTAGWKLTDYKKNPVVLFGHNMAAAPVAKTNRVWVDKDKKELLFDIEFPTEEVSTLGDSLYKLYKSGFMKAVSVGFMPNFEKITYPEKKKGVYRIMEEQALHEISLVSVPANQNALITSKSMANAVEQKIIGQEAMDELITTFNVDEEDVDLTKAIERITKLEAKVLELESKSEEDDLKSAEGEPDGIYAEILDAFKYEADTEETLIEDVVEALSNDNNAHSA